MKRILLFIAFLAFISAPIFSSNINTEASKVSFEIPNMGKTAKGTIKGMQGEVKFDPSNLGQSSFDVCIDPKTIATGIKKRDKDLNGKKLFDTEKFPTICFKSSSIEATDSGYVAKGILTLYDTSKEVEIHFTRSGNTFTGTLSVDRFDYNLGSESYSKPKMIGAIAEVEIICVLQE